MKPYRLSTTGKAACVFIALAFLFVMFVMHNIVALVGVFMMMIAMTRVVTDHQLMNRLYEQLHEPEFRSAAYAFVGAKNPLGRRMISRQREVGLAIVDDMLRKMAYVDCIKGKDAKTPDEITYTLTEKGEDLFVRVGLVKPKKT